MLNGMVLCQRPMSGIVTADATRRAIVGIVVIFERSHSSLGALVRRECMVVRRCVRRRRGFHRRRVVDQSRPINSGFLMFVEHITILNALPATGGQAGAKRTSIFSATGSWSYSGHGHRR